jgi:hypothetical protein
MAMTGMASSGFSATTMAIIAASVTLVAWNPVAAATYKWVDDQGVVHYSDKVPPEAVGKGATVLDKQGRSVKKIEPAPTPEQRKAMEAEEEQNRAAAKAQEERARKDHALMLSYTTGEEIDGAKKRALATIDTQIQSAESYTADLKRRQAVLAKKKAGYGSNPIPTDLERELNSVDIELSRQAALIEQRKADIVTVTARYDADKERWQEIKADPQRAAAATQTPDQAARSAPTKAPAGKPTTAKK